MALEFIERDLQTLVFANNRLATEILVTYLKDACERGPIPSETVRGYRGGYLPRERREIERSLRDGEIRARGGDQRARTRHRYRLAGCRGDGRLSGHDRLHAGSARAAPDGGRATSAAVLVASSAPLDQYIVEHPDYFFGRSPEHAYINPDNLEILLAHLKCAAFELPLRDGEKFGPHDTARDLPLPGRDRIPAPLRRARGTGLGQLPGRRHQPARGDQRQLRGGGYHRRAQGDRRSLVPDRAHHAARKGHLSARSAPVSRGALRLRRAQGLRAARGLRLLHRRHRLHAGEGAGGVRERRAGTARAARMATCASTARSWASRRSSSTPWKMWARESSPCPSRRCTPRRSGCTFPAAFLARFAEFTPTEKQSGISGLGNALRTVAALLLMCDPRDLGVALSEEIAGGLETFEPNLYLYDNYPGGVGQSAPLYRLAPRAAAADGRTAERLRLRGGLPLVRRSGGRGRRARQGGGGADSGGVD